MVPTASSLSCELPDAAARCWLVVSGEWRRHATDGSADTVTAAHAFNGARTTAETGQGPGSSNQAKSHTHVLRTYTALLAFARSRTRRSTHILPLKYPALSPRVLQCPTVCLRAGLGHKTRRYGAVEPDLGAQRHLVCGVSENRAPRGRGCHDSEPPHRHCRAQRPTSRHVPERVCYVGSVASTRARRRNGAQRRVLPSCDQWEFYLHAPTARQCVEHR